MPKLFTTCFRNAHEVQRVQNRLVEAPDGCKRRVNVQQVAVTAQPVQRRLRLACALLGDRVWHASQRVIHLPGPTEAAGASHEDRTLIVEDVRPVRAFLVTEACMTMPALLLWTTSSSIG